MFVLFFGDWKFSNNCGNDNGFVKLAKANKINGLREGESGIFVVNVAIVRKKKNREH